MPTVENRCKEICAGREAFNIDNAELPNVAEQLAIYLLSVEAVNTVWSCNPQYRTKDTIISYLRYLNEAIVGQLLEKGLNLNLEIHSGITQLTWMIGNAENDFVNKLLDMSEKYQTREQRLTWINQTDSMVREIEKPLLHRLFSCESYSVEPVQQTPLQLVIAKGYEHRTGNGHLVRTSNHQLAEQLLKLGADEEINYQEPAKGNTALHLAYARRDLRAIRLLESYGASRDIVNGDGKKPSDMLELTFNKVQNLLRFHTSPDEHPNTFLLDERQFNDTANLANIRIHISNPVDISSASILNTTPKQP